MSSFEKGLGTEKGLDIFEEGIVQASRSSDERKERFARLVAKSLSTEDVKYEESKKTLEFV